MTCVNGVKRSQYSAAKTLKNKRNVTHQRVQRLKGIDTLFSVLWTWNPYLFPANLFLVIKNWSCCLSSHASEGFVGSTEAPSKGFLLFFLLPDWLKLNHLKIRMECGFSDIFSRHFCSIVAETIGVTINPASFGAKKCSENHIWSCWDDSRFMEPTRLLMMVVAENYATQGTTQTTRNESHLCIFEK